MSRGLRVSSYLMDENIVEDTLHNDFPSALAFSAADPLPCIAVE